MAKSNPIELLDGAPVTDLAKAVIQAESVQQSLGGLAADILAKAEAGKVIVVDFINRQVKVFADGTDVGSLYTGAKTAGTITRDDATQRSSPMTQAEGEDVSGNAGAVALKAAVNTMLGAAKPSKNLASLINGIEDQIAKLETLPTDGVVAVISQEDDGFVKIMVETDTPGDAEVEEAFQQDADPITETGATLAWE